jgi:outer membrane protease
MTHFFNVQNPRPRSALVLLALLTTLGSLSAVPSLGPAAPKPQPFSLNVETKVGGLYGGAKEFVYESDGYVESELDWPVDYLVYSGSRLDFSIPSGFEAGLSVLSGFPGKLASSVTDSDYLNGDGVKTHYSVHDCYAERALLIDALAGYRVRTDSLFSLRIAARFLAMNFKWSARDGYCQYPTQTSAPYTPWTASTAKTSMYGTGIVYEQTYLAPCLDLSLGYSPIKELDLGLGIAYSPFVTCKDVDNHLIRGIDFYEDMKDGMLVEPSLSALWRITGKASINLGFSYLLVTGLIGDTTMIYTSAQTAYTAGTKVTASSTGGASYEAWNLSLGFSYRL